MIPGMTDEAGGSEKTLDLVIGLVYGVAMGVQVAWIIDEATDGGLTRLWEKFEDSIREGWCREKRIQRQANEVVWEAIEATMNAAEQ